jgi:hypothetical protein
MRVALLTWILLNYMMNIYNKFGKTRFSGFYPHAVLCIGLLLGSSLAVAASADEVQAAYGLFKQGHPEQALKKVNDYIASNPKGALSTTDAKARFLKGIILTEQRKTEDAISLFSSLTQDYPELPEPYNNLAVLYASQGKYDKAKLALEMAIRTHPSYATANMNLGDIYALMASEAYARALQLNRSDSETQTKLAMIKDLFSTSGMIAKTAPALKNAPSIKAEGIATGKSDKIAKGKVDGGTQANTGKAAQDSTSDATPGTSGTDNSSSSSNATIQTASVAGESRSSDAKAATDSDKKDANGGKNSPNEVLKAVHSWVDAWSSQSVDKYLAFYAGDFHTPDGESRDDWVSARTQRINKPKFIKIRMSDEKVEFSDSTHAIVKFHQTYHSSQLKTNGHKTLLMVKSGGKWLIQEERAK